MSIYVIRMRDMHAKKISNVQSAVELSVLEASRMEARLSAIKSTHHINKSARRKCKSHSPLTLLMDYAKSYAGLC